MKFLKVLLVVVVLLAVVGFFLPTKYAISREVQIAAPAAKVHALVGDLTKWDLWTPWTESDPTVKTTFGAKTTGVGASQTWTSDNGDGELVFTKCDPQEGITYDMAFLMDGKRAPCKSAMTYVSRDGGTLVTWTMQGDMADMSMPVMAGYLQLLVKGSIEQEFDKGLAKLKQQVEAGG